MANSVQLRVIATLALLVRERGGNKRTTMQPLHLYSRARLATPGSGLKAATLERSRHTHA